MLWISRSNLLELEDQHIDSEGLHCVYGVIFRLAIRGVDRTQQTNNLQVVRIHFPTTYITASVFLVSLILNQHYLSNQFELHSCPNRCITIHLAKRSHITIPNKHGEVREAVPAAV